jgi:hypothetical protein
MSKAAFPVEVRRRWMAKALAADPPLAQRSVNGGHRWALRYASLSDAERQRITLKCVIGRYLWDAKRRGLPPPIIHTFEPEQGPDGKIRPKPGTMRPMTREELEAVAKG